jgi:hypothetical protein
VVPLGSIRVTGLGSVELCPDESRALPQERPRIPTLGPVASKGCDKRATLVDFPNLAALVEVSLSRHVLFESNTCLYET